MRILTLVLTATLAMVVTCVVDVNAEERTPDSGLFSEGSFLSEAISAAAGKVNKVASGEEPIIDDDAKGIDQGTLEYDGDPFGRPRGGRIIRKMSTTGGDESISDW